MVRGIDWSSKWAEPLLEGEVGQRYSAGHSAQTHNFEIAKLPST